VSLSFDIFELQKEILPSILKTRGIPTHNPTFYQGPDQGDNQMLYLQGGAYVLGRFSSL